MWATIFSGKKRGASGDVKDGGDLYGAMRNIETLARNCKNQLLDSEAAMKAIKHSYQAAIDDKNDVLKQMDEMKTEHAKLVTEVEALKKQIADAILHATAL
jgi:chromosome segregation ATPase